ncbi:unnamed protein product [Adineta ricciae]|uniref:Uncharacterized protein n=1 Tax=Adineta ricciae TaxID=249248 RepID=A0A815MYZ4_ADIRI|nr:unnamed protein product [Adineta ricciae]
MNDHLALTEDVKLICLRSAHQDNTSIDQLQPIGIDTYEFDDVDECVQYIVSLDPEDTFVFIWLGFGWNHLIPILHQFEQIHCIYLHEPTHHRFISKVHGVFTHPDELLQQLVRDIQTTTIHNPQGNSIQAIWSEVLLQGLMRMPTPSTNVYGEMIKEARYFYRNNSVQLAQIDDFEKNYRREDAIRWYSRDSFVYRLVNKALRTQNLVILFKFRFIIRDIYEHLKKLYHKQYLAGNYKNEEPSTITLYRAMKVSSAESNQLRSFKTGGILSINSFVSASSDEMVAIFYLGKDIERDIMLEIEVDKKLLSSDSLPFADIHTLSSMSDDMEVLLSMGTTLQIQSVTANIRYENICIKTRLCYEASSELKQLKRYLIDKCLLYGQSESYYIDSLLSLLCGIWDQEKLDQLIKLCKREDKNVDCNVIHLMRRLSNVGNMINELSIAEVFPVASEVFSKVCELLKNLQRTPNISSDVRKILTEFDESVARMHSTAVYTNNMGAIIEQFLSELTSWEQIPAALSLPSLHPIHSELQFIKGSLNCLQGNHTQAVKCFERSQASPAVPLFDKNGFMQQAGMSNIVESADMLGIDSLSSQIFEDLYKSVETHPQALFQLGRHLERQNDWSMAILCYQRVIENRNLPPNSMFIIKAYYYMGMAFSKLNDSESELFNYHRAYDLLNQHYPSTHPLVSEIYRSIVLVELRINVQRIYYLLDRKH